MVPLKPNLEMVQAGHRIRLTGVRDVEDGEAFELVCNVTLDFGHQAQISWLKDVSTTKGQSLFWP